MLPKRARLSAQDIEEVLTKGTPLRISSQKSQKTLITARFLAKPGMFKAAAIVPKSVAKNAIIRNQLRRAVYQALKEAGLPKKPGIAAFFVRSIPKKPITPAFREEINAYIEKIAS